ncbi:gastric inhibitory polypeptide [Pezoporus wallicus]|uniref:gastric inhibitory polypeptide n=1 Tax=Pezoporus wallicus TaxID=35540 RepID=UPI00254F002E|nr:gastric inhibitory polypeptide [Pezoporus wallicus]XP_061333476.1 gastric inhibitory polypeptide [Pezoporus flaviventris]
MMSFKVLSLLLASLGFVLMEETVSGVSVGAPSTRPLQRRYSEATLASDYSRTMDNMLKKNFVEWLLARREKKSDNMIEEFKRAAEPQGSAASGQRLDLGTQEAKDFFSWLLKGNKTPSSLEGSEGLKDALHQEFLTWLMSTDLCRATTA